MHQQQGRIKNIADARHFLFGGRAVFTLKSAKTGNRFTYRLRQSDRKDMFFLDLLTGPENTTDYRYTGLVFRNADRFTFRASKQHAANAAPGSCAAIEFLLAMLPYNREFPPLFEFWHAGRCGRCGRMLTDPDSIATGMGPVCREKP